MLGVLLDRDSLQVNDDLELTALEGSTPEWRSYAATEPGQTAGRVADAQVVVSNKVLINDEVMAASPNLKLIAVAATGYNNVDVAAAHRRGIAVCNVRRYATPSVVQHTLSLILALTTRLFEHRADITTGQWQRSEQFCLLNHPIRELHGRTLGIVGYGELGRAVAAAAEAAFGMRILIAQRPGGEPQPGRVPLDELLGQVDVLTLHCPLDENTRGLIGAAEIAKMRDDALLINCARGGLVDEQALVAALREGRLGGAGFDVLSEEPPRHGNPLLADDIPHLILTPHNAWASRESRQRLVDQVAENIRAFLDGAPRNLID